MDKIMRKLFRIKYIKYRRNRNKEEILIDMEGRWNILK